MAAKADKSLIALGLMIVAAVSFYALDDWEGKECLEHVKPTLKDPESARLLKWQKAPGGRQGMLTYTATNGFGGRVQAKMQCAPSSLYYGKWGPDLEWEVEQYQKQHRPNLL